LAKISNVQFKQGGIIMYKKSTSIFVLTLLFITLFKANPEKVQASGLFAPLSWKEIFNSSTTQQFRIIKEYNGSLYAAGHNNAGIDGRLYRFDGVSWQDLNFNTQVAVNVETIEYLYVFNNRLYIGARVNVSGNCYARVYYYDGITFSLDISRNGTCGYSGIESFTIHNGNLYASNGSPLGEVYQRISDGNWITVGSTIEAGSPVRALASYNGSLYAGTGAFGDNARVWRWTGSNWVLEVDFKTGFGTTKDGVINLATVNGLLFAGTDGPGSTSYVFSFDGTNWAKSFELSGCGSTRLSVIDNILWAGFALPGSATCYGQVYRLENGTWIDSGNLGDATQSDFTFFDEYMGNIYGATLNNGKIFYTTLDTISPTVASHTLQTSYTDTGPSTFTVTFSEDVSNPAGDGGTDDVTNPSNYKIINKGANGTLETTACNVLLDGDDSLVLPSSVIYAPNTAIVDLGRALSNGSYRLLVCGTTSVLDLAGNPLNGGVDFTFDFTVDTTATDIFTSQAIQDGRLLESSENSNAGGWLDSSATTLIVGDDNLDRQYRSILHFDTSSLPDNAVITKAVLAIRRQGITGSDPFLSLGLLQVDMRKPGFGAPSLELLDFNSPSAKTNVGFFSSSLSTFWHRAILNNPAKRHINPLGTTQFRLSFTLDDNDNNSADFIRFFSGEASSVNRPKLIITYTLP
jgi:hypothetical protein